MSSLAQCSSVQSGMSCTAGPGRVAAGGCIVTETVCCALKVSLSPTGPRQAAGGRRGWLEVTRRLGGPPLQTGAQLTADTPPGRREGTPTEIDVASTGTHQCWMVTEYLTMAPVASGVSHSSSSNSLSV